MDIATGAAALARAGLGSLGGEVDQPIKAAERQMQVHVEREKKLSASGEPGHRARTAAAYRH